MKLTVARNYYFLTRDTRGCLTPGPLRVRSFIVLGIRQAYENTRALIATAAHNRISVSDCSKTIVCSRQFLIITHVRLKSAMMPLPPEILIITKICVIITLRNSIVNNKSPHISKSK